MWEEEIEDQFQLSQDAKEDLDLDTMMLDEMEQQEEAEIDALLSALPTTTAAQQTRPTSPTPTIYSDDDYDAIFMDFISSHPEQDGEPFASSQEDVEMSL